MDITKIGKKLQAKAGDTEVRNELFDKKKKLKKMVRSKKRLYKKNILKETFLGKYDFWLVVALFLSSTVSLLPPPALFVSMLSGMNFISL